jgi:putative FmdB family regulatory protein
MPTYEYRCPKGHEFEEFQRMSDPPVAACPECGAEAERLLSGGAGLLFKGSGFYITDYRSDSYKQAAAADGKGGGAGSGAASGSSAGGASAGGSSSTSSGGASGGAGS